jgi:hypothetical protein
MPCFESLGPARNPTASRRDESPLKSFTKNTALSDLQRTSTDGPPSAGWMWNSGRFGKKSRVVPLRSLPSRA